MLYRAGFYQKKMFLEFTNGNLGSALCSSLLGKGELFAFLALLNGNQCSDFHSVLLKIIVVKAKTSLWFEGKYILPVLRAAGLRGICRKYFLNCTACD